MVNVVLAVVFGVFSVAFIIYLVVYLVRRSAARVTERLSDSKLVLSVSDTPSGKRLEVQIAPCDVEDNDPDFSDEPSCGMAIPFDILEGFFSGKLPEGQMEYIQGKLREQNLFIDSRAAAASSASPDGTSGWRNACEAAPEHPSGGGKSEEPLLPERVPSPFDAQDVVDNEPDFGTCSGSQIPSEVMDFLLNPADEETKVDCYYCACRLGLVMDFNFRPENRERNKVRLRSLKEQFDGRPVSEVISCIRDCKGLFRPGTDAGKPVFEETSLDGSPFGRQR